MAKKKKGSLLVKVVISLLLIIALMSGGTAYWVYRQMYKPSVRIDAKGGYEYFYVPTGSSYEQLTELLFQKGYIDNVNIFNWLAEKKNLRNHVYPGKYKITDGLNINELINYLRSGKRESVRVTFNNVRLLSELPGMLAKEIEADSMDFVNLFNNEEFIKSYGFNKETFITLFIPNTYEVFWNTSAEELIKRMAEEYKSFWNEDRKEKARQLSLTQSEVAVLASIVQKETSMKDEKPRVAGVYLNRLNKGMMLQADPTLIFAHKDFTIKRVLNLHKEIDSPYNTYKYAGLPPGPICLPEISSLDAVLNVEKHNYIYFCAKEDFSGYHNFAADYNQHLANARKYQNALNTLKVYK